MHVLDEISFDFVRAKGWGPGFGAFPSPGFVVQRHSDKKIETTRFTIEQFDLRHEITAKLVQVVAALRVPFVAEPRTNVRCKRVARRCQAASNLANQNADPQRTKRNSLVTVSHGAANSKEGASAVCIDTRPGCV